MALTRDNIDRNTDNLAQMVSSMSISTEHANTPAAPRSTQQQLLPVFQPVIYGISTSDPTKPTTPPSSPLINHHLAGAMRERRTALDPVRSDDLTGAPRKADDPFYFSPQNRKSPSPPSRSKRGKVDDATLAPTHTRQHQIQMASQAKESKARLQLPRQRQQLDKNAAHERLKIYRNLPQAGRENLKKLMVREESWECLDMMLDEDRKMGDAVLQWLGSDGSRSVPFKQQEDAMDTTDNVTASQFEEGAMEWSNEDAEAKTLSNRSSWEILSSNNGDKMDEVDDKRSCNWE